MFGVHIETPTKFELYITNSFENDVPKQWSEVIPGLGSRTALFLNIHRIGL